MTGPPAPPARISTAQAVGWGIAFILVLVLLVLFFVHADAMRPVLSFTPVEARWPTT